MEIDLNRCDFSSADYEDMVDILETQGYVVLKEEEYNDEKRQKVFDKADKDIFQLITNYILIRKGHIFSKEDFKNYLNEIIDDNYYKLKTQTGVYGDLFV